MTSAVHRTIKLNLAIYTKKYTNLFYFKHTHTHTHTHTHITSQAQWKGEHSISPMHAGSNKSVAEMDKHYQWDELNRLNKQRTE